MTRILTLVLILIPLLLLAGCGTHHAPAAGTPRGLLAGASPALSATMGPVFPSAASGAGSAPGNLTAADGKTDDVFMSGTLILTGFTTFAGLPTNAVPASLLIEVIGLSQDAGRESIVTEQLVAGGQPWGAVDSGVTALPGSLQPVARTQTVLPDPVVIRDPSFGVQIGIGYTGPANNNSTARIDAVRLTLTYYPQPEPTATAPPASPTATMTATATATLTATPAPTNTVSPAPTQTAAASPSAAASVTQAPSADSNGTVILIDSLQRQWDAIRAIEVDAGSAAPQLVGGAPVAELDSALDGTLQIVIEVCARDPGVAAHVLAANRPLLVDWLLAHPDVPGQLSGRAQAWLDEQGLLTP